MTASRWPDGAGVERTADTRVRARRPLASSVHTGAPGTSSEMATLPEGVSMRASCGMQMGQPNLLRFSASSALSQLQPGTGSPARPTGGGQSRTQRCDGDGGGPEHWLVPAAGVGSGDGGSGLGPTTVARAQWLLPHAPGSHQPPPAAQRAGSQCCMARLTQQLTSWPCQIWRHPECGGGPGVGGTTMTAG